MGDALAAAFARVVSIIVIVAFALGALFGWAGPIFFHWLSEHIRWVS